MKFFSFKLLICSLLFSCVSTRIYSSHVVDVNFEWDGKLKNGKSCGEGSYLVIIKGEYGSTYNEGNREPNIVEDEFWIQLFRK